jgi:hypothetical protein
MRTRKTGSEDTDQLAQIVQVGRLFDLQTWIKEGKPIRFSETGNSESSILSLAVGTGFHSIVEELLRAGGWSSSVLAGALELARSSRRFEIAELLEKYGARPEPFDFETCCEKLDTFMIERHLRSGTDPGLNNVFAHALSRIKARPLLGIYRQFRREFPALDDQAALALSEAVQNQHVRWTALLAWAGADPYRPVPNDLADPFPVDPENCTSAAKEAVWRNNPDILKVLHLNPNSVQALELLPDAAYYGNIKLFQKLLASIPRDQINDTTRRSSTALERLVERCAHRDLYTNRSDGKGDVESVQCLEILLDTGARWNPPAEDLRRTRRDLLSHEPRYIVQVLRLLVYTPDAANSESVLELCRSSALEAKIGMVDAFLVKELKDLRKKSAHVNTSNQDDATDFGELPAAAQGCGD